MTAQTTTDTTSSGFDFLALMDDCAKATAHIPEVEFIHPADRPRCKKCGGNGYIPGYYHISNGRCFRCGGSGVER